MKLDDDLARLLPHHLDGPPRLAHHSGTGFNDRLADLITKGVGTIWAFYAFTALSLVSLPTVIRTGDPVVIVAWVAQTFLQLVLLAVLQTSANRSGKAGDSRADATFRDAEAIITTLMTVERHLLAQDEILKDLISDAAQPHPVSPPTD